MVASFARQRFRPLEALTALRALFKDPNDTAQVFKIISALSGGARQRLLRRLRRTPVGKRLFVEQKALATALEDHARLRTLPEGTLGREYLHFCERHGISAGGLIKASVEGAANDQFSWDERLVHARMRDQHDLWHVVMGYETDLLGEACVLAFTMAQTRNPGIALIVGTAFFSKQGDVPVKRRLMAEAFTRGLSAEWFPAVDWEAMLERPLVEVRRTLCVGLPPKYEPLWPNEVMPSAHVSAPAASRAA